MIIPTDVISGTFNDQSFFMIFQCLEIRPKYSSNFNDFPGGMGTLHMNNVQTVAGADRRLAKTGNSSSIFVDPGVKVKGVCYCDLLLAAYFMLPTSS